MQKKAITNEAIRKKYKNQFELVSHAISLAENMILTGRDARVKTDNNNRAMQIIAEIEAGKDFLDPIIKETHHDAFTEERHAQRENHNNNDKAAPERKKARKILPN